MSPSDTLLVLANGGGARSPAADLAAFAGALGAVCRWLAVQMVKDGEGADHAMRVVVREAADPAEAEAVARAVGESPLVKTAAYGRDPNWGRIAQAVGQALAGRGGRAGRPARGLRRGAGRRSGGGRGAGARGVRPRGPRWGAAAAPPPCGPAT